MSKQTQKRILKDASLNELSQQDDEDQAAQLATMKEFINPLNINNSSKS